MTKHILKREIIGIKLLCDDALFLRFDICHAPRLTAGQALPNISRVEFGIVSHMLLGRQCDGRNLGETA